MCCGSSLDLLTPFSVCLRFHCRLFVCVDLLTFPCFAARGREGEEEGEEKEGGGSGETALPRCLHFYQFPFLALLSG